MKLLGVKDDKYVIASMSHYDYIDIDDLMVDGGQPCTTAYAGYNRFRGEVCWFEVPQNFAELYYDYNYCNKNRKYGIWNLEEVILLEKEDWPDTEDFQEKINNAIWGTNGKDGKDPFKYVLLKDCSIGHLQAILANVSSISGETKKIIEHLIKERL